MLLVLISEVALRWA